MSAGQDTTSVAHRDISNQDIRVALTLLFNDGRHSEIVNDIGKDTSGWVLDIKDDDIILRSNIFCKNFTSDPLSWKIPPTWEEVNTSAHFTMLNATTAYLSEAIDAIPSGDDVRYSTIRASDIPAFREHRIFTGLNGETTREGHYYLDLLQGIRPSPLDPEGAKQLRREAGSFYMIVNPLSIDGFTFSFGKRQPTENDIFPTEHVCTYIVPVEMRFPKQLLNAHKIEQLVLKANAYSDLKSAITQQYGTKVNLQCGAVRRDGLRITFHESSDFIGRQLAVNLTGCSIAKWSDSTMEFRGSFSLAYDTPGKINKAKKIPLKNGTVTLMKSPESDYWQIILDPENIPLLQEITAHLKKQEKESGKGGVG